MTTNAQNYLGTYQMLNMQRAANDYTAAERDLQSLWDSNQVRAGYLTEEIKRLEERSARLSGVETAADLDRDLKWAELQDKARNQYYERYRKAEEAYNERWDNQGLGVALTNLASIVDLKMGEATTDWPGWEENLIGEIGKIFQDEVLVRQLGTGKLGKQQLQNEGHDFAQLIYWKLRKEGADVPEEQVRQLVAASPIFAKLGLNADDLKPESLRYAKEQDRIAFVEGATGEMGIFQPTVATTPDDQLTPEQLEMRRTAYLKAEADIARLKAARGGLAEPFNERDVRRRQAEYYYDKPISRGPSEMMMDGLTDEEKIRYRGSLRGGAHAKKTKDLTKDQSSAATYGRQLYDMTKGGVLNANDVTKKAAELATGDNELRDDMLMHFYAMGAQQDQAMVYDQPGAEEEAPTMEQSPWGRQPTSESLEYPFGPESELMGSEVAENMYAQPPYQRGGVSLQEPTYDTRSLGQKPPPVEFPTSLVTPQGTSMAGQQIHEKYGIDEGLSAVIAREATNRGEDPLNWAALIASKSGFDPTHYGEGGEPGLIRFQPSWLAMMGMKPGDVTALSTEDQVEFMGDYFQFINESKAKGITVPQMAQRPAPEPSPTTSVFGPGYAEGARPYTQVVETPTENVFPTPTTRTRPYTQVVETPTTSVFGSGYAPGARPYTQVVETPTTNRDLMAFDTIGTSRGVQRRFDAVTGEMINEYLPGPWAVD